MKILITGGAGFIGANLCKYLLDQGQEVVVLDNFSSGKKENIKEFLENPKFKLIVYDIRQPLKLDGIDQIYHLASLASPDHYLFDPVATLETNVLGTKNILDLALENKAKILFTSTSEIYGDPEVHPQREDYFGNVNPLGRRSCYDEGKRVAETLFMDYHREYRVDIRIVRLFNIYGPKMSRNDGRVISNFVFQTLNNEKITIYGDGSHTRSFMYIDDLLPALTKVMEQGEDIGPINLGNPEEKTILELAENVREIMKSKRDFNFIAQDLHAGRMDDPKVRCPDINRAQSLIHWSPKISLQDGLKKTIEYLRGENKNKTRVLIFSTSFYPLEGPAEKMTRKIIDRLSFWKFDVITAKLDSNLKSEESINNVQVYRLGKGSKWDKYLLPFLALSKAKKLHKEHNYKIIWSVMATYASFAGLLFSLFVKKLPFLITMDKNEKSKRVQNKVEWIYPIYRLLFKKSHTVITFDQELKDKLDMIYYDSKIINIPFDEESSKWDIVTKKVKEALQKLEILGTRLK
jgi:UDP-glucuronate decarboxylase